MLMLGSPQIKSGNWGTGVLLTPESLGFNNKPSSFNDTDAVASDPITGAITRLLQTVTDDGSVAVLSAHYVVPEGNTCECMELPEEELGFEEGCSSTPAAGVIQFEYSDGSCYEMYFDDTEMYAVCDYNSMGDSVPCSIDLSSDASSSGIDEADSGGVDEEDSATATAMTYLAPAEGDCSCIEVDDDYTVVDDTCDDAVTWGQMQVEYSDSTCYTLKFDTRDLYASCDYTDESSGGSQLCSLDLSEDTTSTAEDSTDAPTKPTLLKPHMTPIKDLKDRLTTIAPPDKGSEGSEPPPSSAHVTQFSAGRLLAAITVALLVLY
ncbi:hypothetical protein P3T76_004800 [Phytophthora citrophthora]|uniref:Uncharacterized protein n=1 Tax=Phytophthora citrophthora TaxID=4793 RepID=A0AAD9LQS1_9STRA|nr:hypothetical protein P3T76_004800 [Phytophthora citrophthora]